ncbi:maleylpyruvate isomerase family mycothiol-dependent enzyme (plasmid) [Arthrobacter sp. zg-Y820]|uniref:maleylpyruvate isomerase family mycothiol-dependent enzyme n=1 Tax=unclassified Arthrobacter TaxID=235627 RepID=UPI001E56A5CE|nr:MULTISPECIES: maleylpyruvate isomerase family mycothiol-dependent enzyme [unclassified Arthrobacter]MCC9198507.1 maleylpyruvate isomerase family mycothiol-dependent enzyme [Arthrobacter sp. zg-Y820]MDK1281377.1 maleylpyruvate isomerase family mycothiol-dependent enzyme [Arthrobacter sp. zg.Y820]WIB11231.1 maleylpyruvate isomerase family mycothiol-dependent enzyme [Arthrobacter sp. zg-Y820]
MQYGTREFRESISLLEQAGPGAFSAPSRLPGWNRKQVIGHLAANADAVGRLLHGARTGEPTPMYSSMEQRDADIAESASLPSRRLIAWYDGSADELSQAMEQLTPEQWSAEVRNAVGQPILAATIPWLRARELLIHLVDLGTGHTFTDLPEDFLRTLVADVAAMRSTLGGGPALSLKANDQKGSWMIQGPGPREVVVGPLAGLAAYLTGRSHDDVRSCGGGAAPALERWI